MRIYYYFVLLFRSQPDLNIVKLQFNVFLVTSEKSKQTAMSRGPKQLELISIHT